MTVFDRIKELANKQGIPITLLEEQLNLGKNSLYGWKKRKPSSENLEKVADYFNVSTDYLLSRTDNPKVNHNDNTKIAAHIEDDLTEDELEEVKQFIEYIKFKSK
ncbi:helix-turn-helix transcriptional regulator [Aerococcus sp. UMB8608]|uniref:Cro/Cl family transcriptional regulator n=1 Tax=Aerococcus sanguinicola TaxID=119206 RepID=A0A0X8F9K8_9LACT|nr:MULTISPECIES: helix-turn-helix transcriptional regulator [Aerococcus]AMB93284.1 Cro/Cl family transcriptional regulator [Aerococcus sanguinicola]MDK6679383.1 helix-turn-helix transcriptional regulator [Aerococcus sp. UMB8608]MDK6685775.1 helix-turn-helix transcriptional regulator [Aerococcus sp. UMB8623]OFT95916.1 transcriptional regulator [Aerococcus sp. HMSC23C02]